jgi:hypothetical protein
LQPSPVDISKSLGEHGGTPSRDDEPSSSIYKMPITTTQLSKINFSKSSISPPSPAGDNCNDRKPPNCPQCAEAEFAATKPDEKITVLGKAKPALNH